MTKHVPIIRDISTSTLMDIFRAVKCYLPETLPPKRRREITYVLECNFGQVVDTIQSATHIVTNSSRFEGWQNADELGVEVISDMWVDRSMVLGQALPCQFYSADPSKIFSGMVACGSGIPAADVPFLKTGVLSLGGDWRHGLTKDVTHLFATSPDSDKYATAIKYQETTNIKVLLPHWFDDALRLGFGSKLPTTPYEWPDPKVLGPPLTEAEAKKERTESNRKLSDTTRAFYKTANWDPDKGGPFPGPMEPSEVWGGRKILLSSSLGLDDDRRRALKAAVEAAGGVIVSYASSNGDVGEEDESDHVSECDILVTRWRSGKPFATAIDDGKVVGTLTWVLYVHATGVMSSPMDQLLHYPVRKAPIEDFSKHQITVTNYTGDARDYIKRLIHTMGAQFTPNMTNSNTILIAANMTGIKTEKALSWSIPIVNHTWLEDCFVQWRRLTPAVPKYMKFPSTLDFARMLANPRIVVNVEDLDIEDEEGDQMPNERPPVGTEASVREVEGILDGGDIVMDEEDAFERQACLTPMSKSKTASGRRMVPASVSPTKPNETVMDVDPLASSKQFKKQIATDGMYKQTIVDSPPTRGKQHRRSGDSNVAETQTEAVGNNSGRKGKGRERAPAQIDEDSDVGFASSKGKSKGKNKAGGTVMFAPEPGADSAGPSNAGAPKKHPVNASTSIKRKAQLMESASSGDVADMRQSDSPPPKKRAKSGKGVLSESPSASASISPRKSIAGPGRDSATRHPVRSESLRVLADERTSSARRGTKKQPDINTRSGRNSPTKPQRSSIGTKWLNTNETGDESDVVDNEGRARQPRADSGQQREEMDSADGMPPPKLSKSKTTAGKKDANTSAGSRGSRNTAKKLMTTTITLPDPVLKALAKLGIRMTTRFSECTHLIAPNLVRTEKLLCALAFGAFIISDKWALDSVAANKLLPEEDYILRDKVNERKWDFSLVEAMARAKENGGKLFENKTFYVTSKVPIETKLLKNVVTSQGGKLMTQTPTLRILNSAPGRYIISCPEDISAWRPLTKDHVIYSPELLLTAALTQEIEWDNPAVRVPDST